MSTQGGAGEGVGKIVRGLESSKHVIATVQVAYSLFKGFEIHAGQQRLPVQLCIDNVPIS